MKLTEEKFKKLPRKYYSEDADFKVWDNVERELKTILNADIESSESFVELMEKSGELTTIISEIMAWMYIKMTCYADNSEYRDTFNSFYIDIIAKAQPYGHLINKKFYDSSYMKELDDGKYGHLKRIISNSIELYREENIPLKTKEMTLRNNYGEFISKISVVYDGKEQTLAQLGKYLLEPERAVREEVWKLRYSGLIKDAVELDNLFDELKKLRAEQAKNAGFDNYRDYKHQEMGRFSYKPSDIIEFHNAVEKEVVPFLKELSSERREKLNVDKLLPWDTAVDLDGRVLKPFTSSEELISKGIKILEKVDRDFGMNLSKMDNSDLLDLENRKGKAPGGYNYPLRELGSSFIFMNAVGLHRDVVTLLHEAGHAMHSYATKDITIPDYKDTPSEVAELASMAMEMMTMDYWDEFYSSEEDLRKAKKDQLEGTLKFLPWCMTVDAFQQWIYTNPNHTKEERAEYFMSLTERFNTGVDWSGLDNEKKHNWMFQLHIFEVPFYYIEYGMAQLGALSIYKNYRENRERAVKNYKEFLSLGYTKPVNELYEAAGIEFKFDSHHLSELVGFVRDELQKLK